MRIERDYSSLFKELATENAFCKDRITSGTFGTIARIFHFPPAVTKKVLLQNQHNPQLNQRLKEEKEILKKLFHPNIVSYYGFFKCEDRQNFGLVMEYCDGTVGDVSKLINDPMYEYSLDAVIFWAIQLFDALTYLHSNSVIHRDIKPANIFVAKDFVMKIGDFDGSTESVRDAESIGTDRYRSPKQLRDQDNRDPLPLDDAEEEFTIDERDDVYSMGLVICELLRREFGNKEVLTLMRFRRILNELDDNYAYDMINKEILKGEALPRLECTIKELTDLWPSFCSGLWNDYHLEILHRMEKKLASGVERPNFQCSNRKLVNIVNKCIKLKRENRSLALEVFKELQNLKTNARDPYLLVKEWQINNAPKIPNNFWADGLDDVDELNLDWMVDFGHSNEPREKKEKRFKIGNDNHRSLIFLDSQEIQRHAEGARIKWWEKKRSLSPTAEAEFRRIRQEVIKEKRYEHMLFQGFDSHRGNSVCEAESVENLYREPIDWHFYSKLHQLSVKLIPEMPSAQDYEDWDGEEP